MKKLVALIAVLALVLCAVCASATEVNWSEISAVDGMADVISQGDFVSLGFGAKIWIPSIMPAAELTQEDVDQGYLFYFETADEAAAVAVVALSLDGQSEEDYAAALAQTEGVTDISQDVVNGIQAITYSYPEGDAACMDVFTDSGYVVEITAAPMSDADFQSMAQIILASFQAE